MTKPHIPGLLADDALFIQHPVGDQMAQAASGIWLRHILTGSSGNDTLTGDRFDNLIRGGAGDDRIFGLGGNDVLIGGSGRDTMAGGLGDDLYHSGSGDRIIEWANGGHDIVVSSVSATIMANVEELWLSGRAVYALGDGAANILRGNDLDNQIFAGAGADTIDGGLGADAMHGETGDDVYRQDNIGDSITERLSGGHDTVYATVSTRLAAHVEDLVLFGNAIVGIGNAEDNYISSYTRIQNRLFGGMGNDTLDGRGFDDTLTGGRGEDLFIFEHGHDVITDFRDDVDTIRFTDFIWGELPNPSIDDLLATARVVGNDLVFDVLNGGRLTIRNVTDAAILADDILIG